MFTDEEKKIIERLKGNLAKFSNNTVEEKYIFEKVGRGNCESLADSGTWFPKDVYCRFDNSCRYRISPDYQIPDEYEDIEIKEFNGRLCCCMNNGTHFPIFEIVSLPNFVGFFAGDMRLHVDEVASHIEGKPYVHLRK